MADGQKLTGLRRVLRSTRVSFTGFRHGFLHEAAIREVTIGATVLIILSALLPVTNLEHLVRTRKQVSRLARGTRVRFTRMSAAPSGNRAETI